MFGSRLLKIIPYVETTENGDVEYFMCASVLGLYNRLVDKPDSVLGGNEYGSYPFSTLAPDKYSITVGGSETIVNNPLIWLPSTTPCVTQNEFWFAVTGTNVILKFNIATKEYTLFDYENLPIPLGMRSTFYPENIEKNRDKYFIPNYARCKVGEADELVFLATRVDSLDGKPHRANNMLLRYNPCTGWDTNRVELKNSRFYDSTVSQVARIFPLNDSKVALLFYHGIFTYDTSMADSPTNNKYYDDAYKHSFVIYDLDSNTYEEVVIPLDGNGIGSINTVYTLINKISPYLYGGEEGLCIWYSFLPIKTGINEPDVASYLLFYNPTSGIKDTEEGIFQEIGFRSIYPNPVAPGRRISADVMCYVPDISKVTLGLYNFMGQKVLDLTNVGEYSASTHTISLNFTIPEDLPRGTYFLNIRKGTEIRTKTVIVVGGESR